MAYFSAAFAPSGSRTGDADDGIEKSQQVGPRSDSGGG